MIFYDIINILLLNLKYYKNIISFKKDIYMFFFSRLNVLGVMLCNLKLNQLMNQENIII